MNITVLGIIWKWISCFVVAVTSFFSASILEKQQLELSNVNEDKSHNVINEVIPYEQEITYNSKIPSTISKIVVPGEVGIQTINENNEKIVVKEPITEIIEQGTGASGEYVGKLTGYGPDCAGCSGTGNLACHTSNKGKHNLFTNGIYYEDQEFGSVRILSAATAFPCGTIIKIEKDSMEPFYAVVLDRGGSMNKAWSNGTVWIDLAYASVADARNGNLSGKNIRFSVQRWGF